MSAARSELVRFAAVGTIGFILDAGALYALMGLGLSPYVGKILSYVFAATGTWLLHRHFTFANGRSPRMLRQWLMFVTSNAVGGGINYAVFAAFISLVPAFSGRAALGVGAGSVAGLAFNFMVSKFFVFLPAKIEPGEIRPVTSRTEEQAQ